jgi:hypothetical protein
MSTMGMTRGGGYVQRSSSSGLVDVLNVLLDKGLVVDVFLRVSLVGIELLTVDARIVFAEAVNRLDLGQSSDEGLPQLVDDMTSGGAESKTKGVLQGAKESLFGGDDDDEGDDDSSSSSGSSSSGGSRSRSRSGSRSSSSRGR